MKKARQICKPDETDRKEQPMLLLADTEEYVSEVFMRIEKHSSQSDYHQCYERRDSIFSETFSELCPSRQDDLDSRNEYQDKKKVYLHGFEVTDTISDDKIRSKPRKKMREYKRNHRIYTEERVHFWIFDGAPDKNRTCV